MNEKKVIGLTGTYCAGKNHVASFFEKQGIPVLDVDKLGHQVIEAEKERLVIRFGSDILNPGGFVDRKRLGARVFGKPEELAALEEIIHPAANRETLSWIGGRKEKTCVINAALLHRSHAFAIMDAVIIVEAPFLIRLLRARRRDRLSWPNLLRRFRSQNTFSSQYYKGKTDIYRVENSGFFGFVRNKPEKRIDEIFSLEGIV